MARVLMVIVTVCFVASLSPFLMPGALIGLVGNGLNGALADPVWTLLLPARGTLVASGSDGSLLTLQGVVRGYSRSDGTYVQPHTRSAPTRRR